MTTILLIIVALAAIAFIAWLYGRTLWRHRGERVVVCPENEEFAAVKLDAAHAAGTALRGKGELRLSDCSRWPEKQGCGQMCLEQIEAAPEDCLARNMLTHWYEDSTCAVCSKSIGPINWTTHKPALMAPDRRTLTWDEVPAEKLPDVLSTHWPVCWDCHIAETLVREHPEWVTMRPEHRSPGILEKADQDDMVQRIRRRG
jgi:hypothetical protein